MFKLKEIEIHGFWQSHKAVVNLREDVNIIIGKNGTGKTTFMSIVHAVLTVDLEALLENAFISVTLKLADGKRIRTVRAARRELKIPPFAIIEYQISGRKFSVPLIGGDDSRMMSPAIRRRAAEEAQKIKKKLSSFVAVAALSVHRIGGETDPDFRERMGRRYTSAVDIRLISLMQRLTQYQLELSNAARDVSVNLQKDVLTLLLYDESKGNDSEYNLVFNEKVERDRLVSAYQQLGCDGIDIAKKIEVHVAAVGATVNEIRQMSVSSSRGEAKTAINRPVNLAALSAFMLAAEVIEKSLEAERQTKIIFSQVTLFLSTLKSFITEKNFAFSAGELSVSGDDPIPLAKLSSGEKQLLILFIEALLQRQKPYIFLADEPELSLHIAWQRNIIKTIISINPNAQIIVATHSPEVAGKYPFAILNMEDILHG